MSELTGDEADARSLGPFPLAFIEWRWRPELPPGRVEEFKAEYEQHVAASPARVTLGDLSVCFADALPVLAPWSRGASAPALTLARCLRGLRC